MLVLQREDTNPLIPLPKWWSTTLCATFDSSINLDRHFLYEIETKTCIASIDESVLDHKDYTIDTLGLIYAQKFDNTLNFRELPVSLLRLYFTGQRRFTRCVRKIQIPVLDQLYRVVEQDYDLRDAPEAHTIYIEELNEKEGEFLDWSYVKKCNQLQAYFIHLFDLCFSSFEYCLTRIIKSGDNMWYLFDLFDALENDTYWAGFPIPPTMKLYMEAKRKGLSSLPPISKLNLFVWLTCVWRMNVTKTIENVIKPWETPAAQEWLCYQFKLFRDTHLDILTMMLKNNIYDDETLFSSGLFTNFYPSSHRVCCAEELPDFICYATDNDKTGSNLKERGDKDSKMGHIYVNKTGANICKIRNLFDIIIRYGEEDPLIYDSLKNVLKCVLLGNLPKSRGSLDIMARIRVNLSFFPEEADAVISEAEFVEITKSKSLKRKRAKKKTKAELVYVKTRFKLWLLLCRHFVLYLLKEFHFYIANSSQCFADMLSTDYKFLQYTDIVLIGNGRCRNIISRQCKQLPLDKPLDWTVIEFEEKAVGKYDVKSGEIKKCHAWALKVARKVQKDDFMKILAKKMTGIEESIKLPANYTPFYFVASKGEQRSVTQSIEVKELDEICHYMARTKNRIMETRHFQVIGMSREGLEELRKWVFFYHVYDIPDNKLKNLIMEFQENNFRDFMILKTVIYLIEYHTNEQVTHLPISFAKKQIHNQRKLLSIQDWESTPPLLGFAYRCPGDHKFANPILEPLGNVSNTVDSTYNTSASSKQSTKCPLSFKKDNFGQISTRLITNEVATPQETKEKSKTKSKKKKKDKDRHKDEEEEEEAKEKEKEDGNKRGRRVKSKKTKKSDKPGITNANVTSCFLNTAFYNMEDGRLYCSKTSSQNNKEEPIYSFVDSMKPMTGAAAVASEEVVNAIVSGTIARGQIIMRKKDGSSIVRSSKRVVLRANSKQIEWEAEFKDKENKKTTKERKKRGSSGRSNSHSVFLNTSKEQAAEKLRWLMARREFAIAESNERLGDSVVMMCRNEEDPSLVTTASCLTTTTTTTTTSISTEDALEHPKKKSGKNQKKIIYSHAIQPILDLNYTCNTELKPVDMIGIIAKGGAVWCTECPSMTLFRDYNCTSYGIMCGHHKTASDYDQDPRFKGDKRALKYMALKKEMLINTQKDEAYYRHYDYIQEIEDSDEEKGSISKTKNTSSSTSNESNALAPSSGTLKNQLHPLDIVLHGIIKYTNNENACVYCQRAVSKFRISVIGYHYKIIKLSLCKTCFDHCRTQSRTHIASSLHTIYNHLKEKVGFKPT